ncbi:MAG TPA: efflux RND transporter periplasmic adaptor subunit [Vicinamibacteria bacterium]|nr:efflux RND transporter periplasmic adaptor subunit [Vicinamibacteria bacterium]
MRTKRIHSILPLAAALTFACGGEERASEPGGSPVETSVVLLSREQVPQLHRASGTLVAQETAVLSSRVPGYVRTIAVRAGEEVRAGQELLTIEGDDLEARLRASEAAVVEAEAALTEAESGRAAAEAQYELARATHERILTLRNQRAATAQEMDQAETELRSAEAGLRGAEARLARIQSSLVRARAELDAARAAHGYTSLRAPFDGRVIERPVEVGNLAAPGTPLLTVEKTGAVQAEVYLDEALAGKVRPGDRAQVLLSENERVPGIVSEVEPAVDPQSRSFLARVSLEDSSASATENRVAGAFVRVELETGTVERVLIPESAVIRRGQLELVYVVVDDRARLRLVMLGRKRGDRMEVLSGLDAGDRVIIDGSVVAEEGVAVVVPS